MKTGNQLIKLLFILLNISLVVTGGFYEEPFAARKTKLIIISFIFLITFMIMIGSSFKRRWLYFLLVTIVMFCIAGLEFYAKYAINYFYHSLYILFMIYVLVYFPKKEGVFIGIISTGVSFLKFVELLIIQPNIGNISVFIFYGVIQMLVLVIAIVARNYFEEGQKTKEIYLRLLDTYKQLEDSTKEIERLSMEKERTKIARDLHDTLGHDMTGLIMQIEMGSRFINESKTSEGIALLEEAKKSARESLTKVRQIVQALKTGEAEKQSIASIEQLIKAFSDKTGVEIDFNINGNHTINPDIGIGIYRMIQEGLTNSVRHGKASHIDIQLEFKELHLVVKIKDNGKGCKNMNKGNGIHGMEERIRGLSGTLAIECKNGFSLEASIPYY